MPPVVSCARSSGRLEGLFMKDHHSVHPPLSASELSRRARKITLVLFLAQSLVSAGMIAAATLNAVLGAQLGGSARWAGVPSAVYLLAGAGAALVWGYVMDAIGRRGGLVAGLLLGAAGAALAFAAANAGALPLFLAGMALMGSANAAMQLGRFAAAEVQAPQARGRAISNVVLGGTVGAIVGPLLVAPTGHWAQSSGFDELAGAYVASLVLLAVAAGVVLGGLRPDPRDLGRQVAQLYPDSAPSSDAARPIRQILRQPAAAVAVLAMVLGQVVMVAVMVITSLHMRSHEHGLGQVSFVISSHTFGMFAFSVVSGRLADRWGRGPVILVGAATLVLACLAAPLSPDVLPLAVSLFLLGLGWNFCYVGGSTLLADQLAPAERARTQGFNDLLVGLASALASFSSGLIYASLGYGVMALVGAALAMVPLVATAGWLRSQHRDRLFA